MVLLAIRAFGHLAGLSRKALLQYEELGILLPARVDSHSGYRWYALTQLPQARRIGRLRKLGLPLARIREIVAHLDDQHVLAACWHEQERVFAAQRRLAEFLINQLPGKKADMHGLVDRLALPRDWTTADLSASLEREIDRSVVWLPLREQMGGWCQLAFARQHDWLVFYRHSPKPMLNRAVMAHAAAHLLLHDDGRHFTPTEMATLLTGIDSPNGITTAEMRRLFDSATAEHAEIEATMLADLLIA
ncbi:MerR family transcriptional regulator [Nocardia asiatica]|uniref:MerR family transcriptional regulator n=1 Tax=Nocardia asiatica TaxID=209252 RepID=UPI002456BC98|nr:MerR family transcriptional regulator [Nocardia asiatica]